jgi:hypothetical protein
MLGAARALKRKKHIGGADVENGIAAEKSCQGVDLAPARSS